MEPVFFYDSGNLPFRLDEIALRPNPFSTPQYINFLNFFCFSGFSDLIAFAQLRTWRRALFNEKEKELSMDVAQVNELTRQLEQFSAQANPGSKAYFVQLHLEHLRAELMVNYYQPLTKCFRVLDLELF